MRVAVEKNGKHLATIGTVDRGILGVGVALGEQAGLAASAIEVPGGTRPDETVGWSFGSVRVGDVVVVRLLAGGRRTRPDSRVRETASQRVAEAKRALRLAHAKRIARIAKLERILRSGHFTLETAQVQVGGVLRIWVDDDELCTATAVGAISLRFGLGGIFRPSDASPTFDASVTACTKRQLLSWFIRGRLRVGAVMRVEVLASGRATPPHERTRRRAEPSTHAQVKREIERLKAAELSHTKQVRELERDLSGSTRPRSPRG